MAIAKNEPEAPAAQAEDVAVAPTLAPGFHVMHDGVSLGCYETEDEAEAFADGHPRNNGLTITVEKVAG